jgi:ParB family chromosome partitioning protein
MPVVLAEQGKFYLLCGHNTIDNAQRAGEDVVECVVRQGVSDEEREELRLIDEYFSSLLPPIKMAESFIRHREKYHVTQQELARRTGITAGTVHHYESLKKTLSPKLQAHIDQGELTFKEARCIADIDSHQRQEELAKPFVDSQLSSVHVEELVAKAKADPSASSQQIISEFVVDEPKTAVEPVLESTNGAMLEVTVNGDGRIHTERLNGRYDDDLEGMQQDAFLLAGSLEKLVSSDIPEYRRLRLVSTLRILSSRLDTALNHLVRYKKPSANGHQANRSRARTAQAVKSR